MLNIALLRENPEFVIAGLKKKHFSEPQRAVHAILEADTTRRSLQLESETLSAEANTQAKQIGEFMRMGDKASAETLRQITIQGKERQKELAALAAEAEDKLQSLLVLLPNLPHNSVPQGRTPEENENVAQGGAIPQLPSNAKPHWELIKDLNIIDFELGNKITGAGFPVYRGQGARLQRGLIQFFLDKAVEAGYEEIQPPILINRASGYGTGQLPDKDGQMYHDLADDLFLIPTAEVPITNLYRDEILEATSLPVKNAGYTPCFRREAGSWGAHVRGLNRLHQFDKVEIVQVRLPQDSYEALDSMCGHVESLLNELELPWRKLRLCAGDMSFASALTYDYEVYSAAQERWLEVSSVSNFETFQANRLKLRYRTQERKTALLHTLNGSAMALPRIVAALLENNQTEEGSIKMPEALVPYVRFTHITG
jgi:seryl-tRNA synthetase